MPKPHAVMQRQIRERLQGKTGGTRAAEIKRILQELPPFTDGPYGTMRKQLMQELERSKKQSRQSHHENGFSVEREGLKSFHLVGLPNVGKSALFTALTGKYSKQATHGYSTHGPVAGLFSFKDAKFQLVDLPALPLLVGKKKDADARLIDHIRGQTHQIWVIGLDQEPDRQMDAIRSAVGDLAGRRIIVAGNKLDLASPSSVARLREAAGLEVALVSALSGGNMDEIRQMAYRKSSLMRILMRIPGQEATDPIHVEVGSTLQDVMGSIHKDMLGRLRTARVWGSSVKFNGQNVGLSHCLAEDDILELYLRS